MKWFLNLKVGVKLIIGFILVSIIAGAIGIVGAVNIKKIDNADTALYETMTKPLGEMVTIVESYQRMRSNIKDIQLATTPEQIADFENRILQRNEEFNTALLSYKDSLCCKEEIALLDNLSSLKSRYDQLAIEIINHKKAGNDAAAQAIVDGEVSDLRLQIEDNYRQLCKLKVAAAADTAKSNTSLSNRAMCIMLILIFVGISLSILLGVLISNIIKKPLNKMVLVAKEIADGNLDVELDVNTKDEVGDLAKAFTTMTDSINGVMNNINSTSEQLASGSNQVAAGAQALSQGATEQASSVEELSSTINDITAQIKGTAENAERAKQISIEAGVATNQSQQQMNKMIGAMNEISNTSNEIGKIIKNIDDIAFQTNILALNAAVEAARAGNAGKGFAVVAEEVRNLAGKSAESAKSTAALIASALEAINNGSKIVSETAKALEDVVSGSQQSAEVIQDIADASAEQAQSIAQVNIGIGQISDVVQTNSATAEESAAASEELSGQAQMLKELISKFKLKNATQSGSGTEIYSNSVQKSSYSEDFSSKNTNFNKSTFIDL